MTCAGKRMRPAEPDAALCLVLSLLLSCTPSAGGEPGRSLTVLTWGGAYEAAQRAALFAPFEAETGIAVEIARYDGGLDGLRDALAGGGAPPWDVIDMIRSDALTGCRAGLLAPFDPAILAPAPDGTPAAEDFIAGAFGDCFVTQLVFATVIAYDDRAFPGEKPETVADFFDLARYPGKRALRKAPVGLLDWALRSYGVPRAQIYDLLSTERGLELAFRRLDRIRDDLLWWEGGDAPVDMLREGRAAMASGYNGRFFRAQIEGAPISVIWDSALLEHNTWAIPQGARDADLAERFIRFATRADRLAAMAERIPYGPARRSARRRVGLHVSAGIPMRPHMPTAPRHLAIALEKDPEWYARTAALRARRFGEWLAGAGDGAE